jgi:phage tail sheath protein FI
MAGFLHPGVYVLETGNPPRAIESATTATAIFFGDTERGPLEPTRLTSRMGYTRNFGGYLCPSTANQRTLAHAMDAFFGNGGQTCYVVRTMSFAPGATASRTILGPPTVKIVASSPGTWANGLAQSGVSVIFLASSDGEFDRFRIVVIYTPLDTPGVSQIVEDWDRLSVDSNDENYVVDVLKRSLYVRWDPGTVPALPIPPDLTGPQTPATILMAASTGAYGLIGGLGGDQTTNTSDYDFSRLDDIADASLLVIPLANANNDQAVAQALNNTQPNLNINAISYCITRPRLDLFYIGSLSRHNDQVTPDDAVTQVVAEWKGQNSYPLLPKSDFAALYFPWIQVSDPVGVGKDPILWVSPSATMAGIYARTDASRGVWKAPAGIETTLLGARALEFNLQDVQQDALNPLGICALRNIPNIGMVCWGARTMVPSSQWRYVNVRRMAIFLRQSIYNGIQYAVFEGNDTPLWASLRLTINAFMDGLYHQGAFAGASPADAYFVKCDKETTTPKDQEAGVVNVLVGFAPERPAEFVIVKLSQMVLGGG